MIKEFRKFFICLSALLVIAVMAILVTAFSYKPPKVDMLVVNDCVESAKENWDEPSKLDSMELGADIMIIDRFDKVMYMSPGADFEGITSVVDAASRGYICSVVREDELYLGTIIISDPTKNAYDVVMHKIICVSILLVLVMLIVYLSFYIYVNHNIIRPFIRMKAFAGSIAEGNLDEPLMIEKNNIFGLFTESFDIMREELKASKKRELQLKRKEKELIASLSHDLRTPVTGIKLICELLEIKVKDEYVKAKIENILHKTEQINLLLNDLLSSSLDDLGEMNVKCDDAESRVLSDIVREHDIEKKISDAKAPDCIISVDINRLSQVIGNIISNSYKYAGTEIDITYGFKDRFLEMSFQDHGKGVEPEEVSLLTNKFYRGKNNTSGKEGSGLGLYISSELMRKMNGQLICSSGEDGFRVTLLIPLA